MRASVAATSGGGGRGGGRGRGAPSELIVANVHLLFPHNEVSQAIRVRELHKLLTYLDEYKATLARPLPALICGDFNGRATREWRRF